MYKTPVIQPTPVQVDPRNTIPAHNNVGGILQHDKNWIDFLNSLPISDHLIFRTSPFRDYSLTNHKGEQYFPKSNVAQPYSLNGNNLVSYGEGFQIEWAKSIEWEFKINFLYVIGGSAIGDPKNIDPDRIRIGHTVVFNNLFMLIDGAKLYNYNLRTIPNA